MKQESSIAQTLQLFQNENNIVGSIADAWKYIAIIPDEHSSIVSFEGIGVDIGICIEWSILEY